MRGESGRTNRRIALATKLLQNKSMGWDDICVRRFP